MFQEIPWKKVLRSLYLSTAFVVDYNAFEGNDLDEQAIDTLSQRMGLVWGIGKVNCIMALSYMKRHGLIQIEHEFGGICTSTISLTNKGFDVALDDEKYQNQIKENRPVKEATIIMALASFLTIAVNLFVFGFSAKYSGFLEIVRVIGLSILGVGIIGVSVLIYQRFLRIKWKS